MKKEQKMEWIVIEKLSLSGLSLKQVHELIGEKIKKHGEDVILDISSETQTNYSSRVDSSYTTSQSICNIKKLMPALTAEEKAKERQEQMEKVIKSVAKMFEDVKFVKRENS